MHGRSSRPWCEDDRWSARFEKLARVRGQGCLPAVPEREADDMCLGRPVGLRTREPVRKEPDHELWRMKPAMHHAIDRWQAECRAELIHGALERAIDQEPVRETEKGALEPHRLGRRDPDVPGHALVDKAADDARLKV